MCEGLQDLFLYCKDWPFHNMFLNQIKNGIICQKEKKKDKCKKNRWLSSSDILC